MYTISRDAREVVSGGAYGPVSRSQHSTLGRGSVEPWRLRAKNHSTN